MTKFKPGDRVLTTAFPPGVDASRGHRVGDLGTVLGAGEDSDGTHYVYVEFDYVSGRQQRQGMPQGGFSVDCWACKADELKHELEITPELLEEGLKGLAEILGEETPMRTITIETTWRSVQTVEVPDDYEFTGGLDEEWADQVDAAGASLVDWDVQE